MPEPSPFAPRKAAFVQKIARRLGKRGESDPVLRELALDMAQLVTGAKRRGDVRTYLQAVAQLERLLARLDDAAPAGGRDGGRAGGDQPAVGGVVAGFVGAGPEVRDSA